MTHLSLELCHLFNCDSAQHNRNAYLYWYNNMQTVGAEARSICLRYDDHRGSNRQRICGQLEPKSMAGPSETLLNRYMALSVNACLWAKFIYQPVAATTLNGKEFRVVLIKLYANQMWGAVFVSWWFACVVNLHEGGYTHQTCKP